MMKTGIAMRHTAIAAEMYYEVPRTGNDLHFPPAGIPRKYDLGQPMNGGGLDSK